MARFPVTNELYNDYIRSKRILHPVYGWENKKDHPVVFIKRDDAIQYLKWLNSLLKVELPANLILRLPTESEWEKAARGTDGREYPWGNVFDHHKCNTSESEKSGTTSVGLYSPLGDSPYGCADMSGNSWELTCGRFRDGIFKGLIVVRGGSHDYDPHHAATSHRHPVGLYETDDDLGFRVVLSHPNTLFS